MEPSLQSDSIFKTFVLLSAVRHLSTVPHVSTNTHRGLVTPITCENCNNHRLLNPSFTTDLPSVGKFSRHTTSTVWCDPYWRKCCHRGRPSRRDFCHAGSHFFGTRILRNFLASSRLQRLRVSGGEDDSVYVPGLNGSVIPLHVFDRHSSRAVET